jgi:hypothetical protein
MSLWIELQYVLECSVLATTLGIAVGCLLGTAGITFWRALCSLCVCAWRTDATEKAAARWC